MYKQGRKQAMSKFILSGFADEIDANFDAQLSHLQKLGIKFFEIRGVDGKNVSALTDEEVLTVKAKIDACGIKVSAIGSPVGKDEITEAFSSLLERFERVVKIAKMLSARYIRIFSFFNAENNRDEVVKRLSEFVKIAEREDVILLHENEKDIFGESAENCKYLFDNIKSPCFRGIFDPANFVQAKVETYPYAFKLLKDNIVHMHIKDATESGSVVPSGYGAGKLKEILEYLNNEGFEGFLSLEPHLGNFAGFSELEGGKNMKTVDSGPDKFTLAFESLTKILNEIGAKFER